MRNILILLSFIALVGCNTDPIKVTTVPAKRIKLTLPKVDRYVPYNIKWIVITPETAEEIFEQLQKKGLPISIIGVTGEGYKSLGHANGDKAKFVKQLQAIIKAYESYYLKVEEQHNKPKSPKSK